MIINLGLRTAVDMGIVAAMFYVTLLCSYFLPYLTSSILMFNVLSFRRKYDHSDITW